MRYTDFCGIPTNQGADYWLDLPALSEWQLFSIKYRRLQINPIIQSILHRVIIFFTPSALTPPVKGIPVVGWLSEVRTTPTELTESVAINLP